MHVSDAKLWPTRSVSNICLCHCGQLVIHCVASEVYCMRLACFAKSLLPSAGRHRLVHHMPTQPLLQQSHSRKCYFNHSGALNNQNQIMTVSNIVLNVTSSLFWIDRPNNCRKSQACNSKEITKVLTYLSICLTPTDFHTKSCHASGYTLKSV